MLPPQEQNFQGVDHTSALNVEAGKKIFDTPNTTPSSSSRGSAGGAPKPLPRTSSPRKDEAPSPISINPFDSDAEEEEILNNESKEPLYATIDKSTKSPKKSSGSDSGVGDQNFTPIRRSDSEETVFSPAWDLDNTTSSLQKRLSGSHSSDTPSASSTSSTRSTDDSEAPLLQGDESNTANKITNRLWPRVRYAMQQKGSVAPMVGATFITAYLAAYTALAYMQNKSMFIAFITNNPKFIIVQGIIAASLFAIGIFCAIKQFNNTIEHEIQEKNPDKVLKKVLDLQPEGKVIKSVRLEYSNNTHSNFTFNTWKSHKGFINIDEKVINRTSKIESVFNDRPVFTALLTGFVVANVALPLGLYVEGSMNAAGGMNNVATFYQSLIATNIGLSLLVASTVLALSILCLGVHYYNKTNCTNLGYSCKDLKGEYVNPRLIEEVKKQRVDVLGENHNKEAKCSSLMTERVVVEAHNCSTLFIECC